MRIKTWIVLSFFVTTGLLVLTLTTSATAGGPPATIHDTHVIPAGHLCATGHCASGHCASGSSCTACSSRQGDTFEGPACELSGNRFVDFWRIRKMKMGSWVTRMRLKAYGDCDGDGCRSGGRHRSLRDKFGYFHPTGCCGGGCPLAGKYDMVYSANPTYFDPRDGRLYAAQGTNVPMAVPLAPNVRYTYNYGWGIPSSRLTRVSRVAPEISVIQTGR